MIIQPINLFIAFTALCTVVLYVESCHSDPGKSDPNNSPLADLNKNHANLYRSIRETQLSVQQELRSKRSVHQYFLELLIVVDRSMVEFHGDELVPYLKSILAFVQHRFKYALVDDSIQLQLTDIFQLMNSTKYIDYTNGTTILDSFCTWKQKSQHCQHDAALFLTRAPIPDNIMGYANRESICGNNSCLIVHDNGLGSVNTIAHELGHVLGAHHDETKFCQTYFGNSTVKYIMAAINKAENQWWQWSECSTWTMTDNLRNLEKNCLTPNPKGDYLKLNADHSFIGLHYSMDKQCELLNRTTPRACAFRPCEHLRCKQLDDSESYCFRENYFWADGTECGAGKWCENGQCVQAEQELIQRLMDSNWIKTEKVNQKTESESGINALIKRWRQRLSRRLSFTSSEEGNSAPSNDIE